MIGRLAGTLLEKTPTRVVLDVAGVGYEVLIPLSTFYELPDEGKTLALAIHTHVREDALQLFGFMGQQERAVFELLLRTSGVGPKLAQAILSELSAVQLVEAVRAGDAVRLRKVPGVGAKTAERLVIDLRDRVDQLGIEAHQAVGSALSSSTAATSGNPLVEQVVSALMNLGYPQAKAEHAAKKAYESGGEQNSLEGLVRAALQRVAR